MFNNHRPQIKFVKSSTVDGFLSLPASGSNLPDCSASPAFTGEEAKTLYKNLLDEEEVADGCKVPCTSSAPPQVLNQAQNERLIRERELAKAKERLLERDRRLFFQAAAHGEKSTLKEYLTQYEDLNINMKDEHGWTPLMCAAAEGHAATVELLVGEGANTTVVDSRGRNAEVLASKFRHCDVMQYLEQVRIHPKIDESDDDIEIIDDERYCKECGISYKDRSHFTSIAHLMEISKPVEASGYGIPEWNIGYRMLQRTGWHEYRGLGKDGKGKRYPIRTAFKRDRKGLGLDKNIVMRVTHPDAHIDRPRYKASKYSAIKLREDEIRKDKKIATKFRQEFS